MKSINRDVVLLIFFALSVSCCSPNDNIAGIKMLFKSEGYNVPFHASQIVASTRYLALDNTIMVGEITDIRFCRNNYYVSERNRLYVFDSIGRYSFSIEAWGRAEDEYISLDGFDVNFTSGEISILDLTGSKVLVFSGDGTFLRFFRLNTETDIPRKLCSLDNGDYILYNPLRDELLDSLRVGAWIVDSVGCFKKELISIDEDYYYGGYVPYQRVFSRLGDGTISLMGAEDHDYVYHISQDEQCEISYKMQCDLKIPKKYYRKPILSESEANDSNCYSKYAQFETDNLIITVAFNPKKSIWIYYDKRFGVEHIIDSDDDFIDDIGFSGICCNCANDRLINIYYPGTDEDIDIKLGASTSANPYLIIAYLK